MFICECKFWSGAEGLADSIDQLFRYTAWRDTKLAIVMFVREKGLTAILKKARAMLEKHPQFVAGKDATSETELRATMHWPGDEERLADLNVSSSTRRSRRARRDARLRRARRDNPAMSTWLIALAGGAVSSVLAAALAFGGRLLATDEAAGRQRH